MSEEWALLCVALPMLLAAAIAQDDLRRVLAFGALGAACAWCAAYVNAFVACALVNNGVGSLSVARSVIQLTPIVEEAIKLMPLGVYMMTAAPNRRGILIRALGIAVGFAAVEAVVNIAQTGASVAHMAAALTHLACACIIGLGMGAVWGRPYLAFPGGFATLCAASTFHAIYNLLVPLRGTGRAIAFAMPVAVLMTALWLVLRARSRAG